MIETDITDAYQATIDHGNQAVSNFNFIETERAKISHNLTEIENQIEEFLMTVSNLDYRYFDGQTISFESMAKVNGLVTTALVNLNNREVTLFENDYKTNRIILQDGQAQVSVLKPYTHHAVLEPINNAFDDDANSAWWHVVKTDKLDDGMKIEFTILFNQEEEINHIEYIPHNSKEVYVTLEYTLDGNSFSSLLSNGEVDRVTEATSWTFQPVKARGIKLVFNKSTYDDRSAGMYQYYFGAKNIAIYKKSYVSESIFYSLPIVFNEKVRQVSIATTDTIPHNTSIDYEMAVYRDGLDVESHIWHPISSTTSTNPKYPTYVDLNVTKMRKVETTSAVDTGEIVNGMRVFKLISDTGSGIISEEEDTDGVIKETFEDIIDPKLFRGINQWKCESVYQKFNGDVPINSQWESIYTSSPQAVQLSFFMKGNRLACNRPEGSTNNFYRFTTCIHSDHEKSVPLSISVLQTLTSGHRKRLGSYSVYLNKKRLAPSNDEVTLDFVEGWNEVQILYHWGDMEKREDISAEDLPVSTYIGKMDFAVETKMRAELEPMGYIESNSLYYNISPNNRDYFAIKDRQVVLNYLPVNTIFQLIYESKDQDKGNNSIMVRAKLERDANSQHITPKIKRINLLGR